MYTFGSATGWRFWVALVSLLGAMHSPARDRKSEPLKPGEWEVLFSRKSHQFRGYKLYDFPKRSWKVEKGELKSLAGAPQVDLVSLAMYQDFELELEWRVAAGGDGGVLYRVMEDEGPTWHSGLEYQLLDDAAHPDGKQFNRTSGSLYDVAGAKASAAVKPSGGYNVSIIKVVGSKVEHWLNGEQVLQFDLESPQFKSMTGQSKFKNLPRFGREKEGHICLQHMGNEVAFRSIRIRRVVPLDASAPAIAR